MKIFLLIGLATLTYALKEHTIGKRVLPIDRSCDPASGRCRKGDWVAESIADCEYHRSRTHWFSCDAKNDDLLSWIVDEAKGDRCKPVTKRKRFTCGASGTDTRCVCSDTNPFYIDNEEFFNTCKCQYWPPEDIGAHSPAAAFCTGYYTGGTSTVHHWACCNNCNDPTPNTCDGITWQGGSRISYCSSCGQSTGDGRVEYYFNCGSCNNQQTCKSRCSSYNFPTGCWKWLECFLGCCLETTPQPSASAREDLLSSFCGDGICSETETPASCPGDCCYQINSEVCTNDVHDCRPDCCREPNCCLENNSGISNGAIAGIVGGFVLLTIAVTVLEVVAVVYYKKWRKTYKPM